MQMLTIKQIIKYMKKACVRTDVIKFIEALSQENEQLKAQLESVNKTKGAYRATNDKELMQWFDDLIKIQSLKHEIALLNAKIVELGWKKYLLIKKFTEKDQHGN
jgi:antitoxin component of RelBE/YafQ-DinJ toxin-antitoxin module